MYLFVSSCLTFNCLSYFSLPFVHGTGAGVHLDPFIFEYFPVRISVRNLHHMCIHPKQVYISKRNDQQMFCFKMAAKNEFSIHEKKSRDQI